VTSADNLIVAVLVLGFILWRQLQPRAVREDSPYRLMLVLGVIGVVDRSASGVGADAILLYLGVALAAQRFATLSRAERLEPA
jgi:hypothetical protein